MIHGINNNYLYAVSHIQVGFLNTTTGDVQIRLGTGFFVTKDGQIYFITNRHVIDITREGAQYANYSLDSIQFDLREFDENSKTVSTQTCKAVQFIQSLPDGELDDVACLSQIKLSGGKAIVNNAFPFDLLADSDCLSHQISVCDSVAIIGFPSVYDHLNDLPILRAGVISSDPRLNYSYNTKPMGRVIAYEAFSTGGASGSPVIALQKGFAVGEGLNASEDFFRPVKIVGVNAGNMKEGEVHQHMSYMFKSDVIRELILESEKEAAPKQDNN